MTATTTTSPTVPSAGLGLSNAQRDAARVASRRDPDKGAEEWDRGRAEAVWLMSHGHRHDRARRRAAAYKAVMRGHRALLLHQLGIGELQTRQQPNPPTPGVAP